MRLDEHWQEIRQVFARAQGSMHHCSIASVGPDGMPNVTPIGTVFLRDDRTGFYFDQYTSTLASNLDADPRVCVMAVDTGAGFWFRALFAGRFPAPPGVRLYGTASALRPATDEELDRVARRVRPTRWLKGSQMLWSRFSHVRDLTFTEFRPVRYPVMMEDLWQTLSADPGSSASRHG